MFFFLFLPSMHCRSPPPSCLECQSLVMRRWKGKKSPGFTNVVQIQTSLSEITAMKQLNIFNLYLFAYVGEFHSCLLKEQREQYGGERAAAESSFVLIPLSHARSPPFSCMYLRCYCLSPSFSLAGGGCNGGGPLCALR